MPSPSLKGSFRVILLQKSKNKGKYAVNESLRKKIYSLLFDTYLNVVFHKYNFQLLLLDASEETVFNQLLKSVKCIKHYLKFFSYCFLFYLLFYLFFLVATFFLPCLCQVLLYLIYNSFVKV